MAKLLLAGLVGVASGAIVRVPVQQVTENGFGPRWAPGSTEEIFKSLQNTQYFIDIQLGSQNFRVTPDVGTGNLWVPAKNCSLEMCGRHARYDWTKTKSSTYKPDGRKFDMTFGSHSVEGVIASDTFKVGDISVPDQFFAQVSKASSGPSNLDFAAGTADGILGLAFKPMAQYGLITPFEAMVQQKLVDEPVFAFYLSSQPADTDSTRQLVFGGIDKSHYSGELLDVPLTSEKYWEVSLDRLTYGSDTLASSQKTFIDPGTSFLVGPKEDVDALAKTAGATSAAGRGFVIDCSKTESLPKLTVVLGGKDFVLEGKDYVINVGGQCIFAFMGIDVPHPMGAHWIMGDVFLKKYYCVYDYGNKQMRMAPAVHERRLSSMMV